MFAHGKVNLAAVGRILAVVFMLIAIPGPVTLASQSTVTLNGVSNPTTVTERWASVGNELRDECTIWFAVGRAANDGTLIAQNGDSSIGAWLFSKKRLFKIVEPENENRYIVDDMGTWLGMNEKGVCSVGASRFGNKLLLPEGAEWKQDLGQVLARADTAEEAVKMAGERMLPSGSQTYADTREAWIIEKVCGHTRILGPFRDQAYASSNYILCEDLVPYGIGGPFENGIERARRARQLLEERCGRLTVSYFFQIARDHGGETIDLTEYRGSYKQTICNHGVTRRTLFSIVMEPREKYTDLLSRIWYAPGTPCTTPFLPLYIGVTEIPDTWAAGTTMKVFNDLHRSLEYNPDYKQKILNFWRAFEFNTLEEAYLLEQEVQKLINDGRRTEAREMLTEFVQSKSQEAIFDAVRLTKKVREESLIDLNQRSSQE